MLFLFPFTYRVGFKFVLIIVYCIDAEFKLYYITIPITNDNYRYQVRIAFQKRLCIDHLPYDVRIKSNQHARAW